MKSTWIVAADSAQARIFTIETPSSPLEEIEVLTHPGSRLQDREITSDLPGRIKSSNSIGHAYEPRTGPKEHEAVSFAHELAERLESALNANQFERLLIIAEPSFLGLLRNQLPEQVKKRITFELDKNITKQTAKEIRSFLPEYF